MTILAAVLASLSLTAVHLEKAADPTAYDVIWNSPSNDSSGSMPIGNGDIGANVWVEPNGDVLLYLSKTDAWSENCRLLKLGRIRITLTPNPFNPPRKFLQVLALDTGTIVIQGGSPTTYARLRIWVDANYPALRIAGDGTSPFSMRLSLEPWRNQKRQITGDELSSAYGLMYAPHPVYESADIVFSNQHNRVAWCHRNETSIWRETLDLQGLAAWAGSVRDPLLNRTFGGVIVGDGLVEKSPTTLESERPKRDHRISVLCETAQSPTVDAWLEKANRIAENDEKTSIESAYSAHCDWWRAFWNRSYVHVTSDTDKAAFTVTQGYTLQRFITACAGRGAYPIKFNGSIFTVDPKDPKFPYDADYRNWGGPYWFQNTRLIYWLLMATGDFEFLKPFFRMYTDALPLATARTPLYFNHNGAFFPETMYFWGAYANDNYGWNREGKPISLVDNRYIRWYWQDGLELLAIMLDYHAYTGDAAFVRDSLLPTADAVLAFYDQHYSRDTGGKLLFKPSQSLETWQDTVNPLPEIAGLQAVLDNLLALPDEVAGAARKQSWRRLRSEVPPLPLRDVKGERVLSPAEKILGKKENSENPELYAVFPYRLFGVGKPNLDLALRTFKHREEVHNTGWCQDAVQAACLGLGDTAAKLVAERFATKNKDSRFPAFWGPNYDWVPDQDHGCNGMIALQSMLIQCDGERILLFPAWPANWDVEFKLYAPNHTTVHARLKNGKLVLLNVNPSNRKKAVEILLNKPAS